MKSPRAPRVGLWVRRLRRPRVHPTPATLSRYIDADLSPSERNAVERHVAECVSCRRLLASLRQTIGGLGSLAARAPSRLPETIVAALPRTRFEHGGAHARVHRLRVAVRYCLQRSQLRLTVPSALLVGAALILLNQGAMLLHGHIDVGMCAICSLNFLLPFAAMNVVLATATRLARRR
jgi:anti-sigma factor RsiW